jgi:sortase A
MFEQLSSRSRLRRLSTTRGPKRIVTRVFVPLALGVLVSASCQAPVAVQLGAWSFSASTSGNPAAAPAPEPAATPFPAASHGSPTATPTSTSHRAIPAVSVPDRIIVPAINLDAPVVEVQWRAGPNGASEWETSDSAAGFLAGSALPGATGNTVISGHHNIEAKVFERLYELQPGDEIRLLASGRAYRYAVEDSFILPERGVPDVQREQNARWIGPTSDERLTLVTCWPANDNSHRLIVIARPDGD